MFFVAERGKSANVLGSLGVHFPKTSVETMEGFKVGFVIMDKCAHIVTWTFANDLHGLEHHAFQRSVIGVIAENTVSLRTNAYLFVVLDENRYADPSDEGMVADHLLQCVLDFLCRISARWWRIGICSVLSELVCQVVILRAF